MTGVFLSGSFDNLRSIDMRFIDESAQLGPVTVLLWSDALVERFSGKPPRFPQAERQYFLEAVRFVSRVIPVEVLPSPHELPLALLPPGALWTVRQAEDTSERRAFCHSAGIRLQVIPDEQLRGFPLPEGSPPPHTPGVPSGRKQAIVTGCYDWLHSGHVRFFEEVSELGDLIVAVGNDKNVRHLKGEGHPLFPQEERLYMVAAIRYVHLAVLTSGMGWMDAEPEVERLKPHIYAVNEDGDKPEKRAFCARHGLEYVVLKRLPKEGLPRRESTKLRGF